MRRILCLAATTLLAACGDAGSEDFSFEVAMAPDKTRTALGKLDGGDLLRALRLTPITAQRGEEGDLAFVLPSDAEPGALHMRFEETGTHGTRVHVALDLPARTKMIDGELMELSESAVEDALKEGFEGWAETAGSRGYASLDDLNTTLGGVSIILQGDKFDQLLAASNDPSKLAGLIDPAFGKDGSRRSARPNYEEQSRAMGEPMVDTEEDLEAASAPMDDAKGTNPNPGRY